MLRGVDDNRQEQPRPERQPGRLLHVPTPFRAEQASPVGTPGGQTESEETQRSQTQDVAADADAENDDDDRHDIGHDMSDQGPHSALANRLCRQKVIILLDGDHGASDYSGAADASAYPHDQYYLWYALPHYRNYGEQQQQTREHYPGIDNPLHHDVELAAEESGSAADHGTDHRTQSGDGQTDQYRKTTPQDQAAQEVSSYVVGPQEILGG